MTARTSPPIRVQRCASCGASRRLEHLVSMPIGPGRDELARAHARRGEPFAPHTLPICRPCAFGDELEDDTKPAGGDPPA